MINVFKSSGRSISPRNVNPRTASFGAKLEGRELEFRVATSEFQVGRKDGYAYPRQRAWASRRLDDAGLRPKLATEIRNLVTQPHGMFICCGPTGSGKTTTLYACLREIDRFQKNIITVEDPIEYHLDNIYADGDQHQERPNLLREASAPSSVKTPT